ncbi:MAG: PKD domain-containing protein, partial [Flavobacteriia bacterium]|nr:PKD domain-containing protein [Flavobacteriia bacterium]
MTATALSQSATFTSIPAAVNGSINICAGSTVLFTSTVNPATLLAPAVYAWNFGNGQTSAIPGPVSTTYPNPGTYTVTYNIS